MTDRTLAGFLGSEDRDPGCEAGFQLLDEYCEAVRRGEDVARRYPELVTHIANCTACREDTEGMLAAVRLLDEDGGISD
jgi:hypothetical protein